MSFLSLLPAASAQAAREAVTLAKVLASPIVLPRRSELDALANGYLTGELFPRRDLAGNARGEALALGIASPERRILLLKAGCKPGPSYCPSFLAPKGWASGRSDVGLPVGLWNDEAREDAPARHADWKPRPAWDAIEPKPCASAVWTQEGWKA
jgi:hypothetical protein